MWLWCETKSANFWICMYFPVPSWVVMTALLGMEVLYLRTVQRARFSSSALQRSNYIYATTTTCVCQRNLLVLLDTLPVNRLQQLQKRVFFRDIYPCILDAVLVSHLQLQKHVFVRDIYPCLLDAVSVNRLQQLHKSQ